MENPVCALVEKQFVTTFPGAVELRLIGRVFTYAGRAGGAAQAWGEGHGASLSPQAAGALQGGPYVPSPVWQNSLLPGLPCPGCWQGCISYSFATTLPTAMEEDLGVSGRK